MALNAASYSAETEILILIFDIWPSYLDSEYRHVRMLIATISTLGGRRLGFFFISAISTAICGGVEGLIIFLQVS